MVEEIITALSLIRWLFVIARNSSFTYKGQAIDVKQVGRELGVRYVLEGAVRTARRCARDRQGLRAITPAVMKPATRYRNPERRELFLSGLRLAASEAS